MMCKSNFIGFCFLAGVVLVGINSSGSALFAKDNDFTLWGRQTLQLIERDHRIKGKPGYYEDQEQEDVAFTWSNAMLLLAYAKAAQQDGSYHEPLESLSRWMQSYWVVEEGISGYDVLPHPRSEVDRYYDDNAWIAMGQIDAYEATQKKQYLLQAGKSLQFCLRGIDRHTGGIWWKESWESKHKKTKNTCSIAPTAFACLRYYQLTKESSYFKTAVELLTWLDTHLKDQDSLYFDCIDMMGRINRKKWSYNSAMPMRCYILLYEITGKQEYLDNALGVANASQKQWIRPSTGSIQCEAMFAFTLIEGWIELSRTSGDMRWKELAESSLIYVHEKVKDPNGRYSRRWDDRNKNPITHWKLLYPASTARAYWVMVQPDGDNKSYPVSAGFPLYLESDRVPGITTKTPLECIH